LVVTVGASVVFWAMQHFAYGFLGWGDKLIYYWPFALNAAVLLGPGLLLAGVVWLAGGRLGAWSRWHALCGLLLACGMRYAIEWMGWAPAWWDLTVAGPVLDWSLAAVLFVARWGVRLSPYRYARSVARRIYERHWRWKNPRAGPDAAPIPAYPALHWHTRFKYWIGPGPVNGVLCVRFDPV
jgi:hypothetical protein